MQDHYEHQQDEYYRNLKEKRARKKKTINMLLKNFLILLLGNAFCFAIYFIFLSKLISEKISGGDEISAVALWVCVFGIIVQIATITVISVIISSKNEEERRALLHASRQDTFSHRAYYIDTWKRSAWVLPVAYLVMQLPFMIYYTVLGYFYEAETIFAHFFIPQLPLCELTGNGFVGCFLNTLLLSVIYGASIWITQRIWLRERIRV